MPVATAASDPALRLGDHLALDFLNTCYGTGSAMHERFVDDAGVLAWLQQVDVLPAHFGPAPEGLLALALTLREETRALVTAAQDRRRADARTLNRILDEGRPRVQLRWNAASRSHEAAIDRRDDAPASLLEPVARAVVQLLTEGALDRVKQCEAHDCTLVFHDRTPSHRRRWCSMALCGNRMKVAAFRQRQRAEPGTR